MPVYTFEIAPFLAGRSVTVRDAAGSTVASGTLDANAKFTASLGVGDYVASASDGRYTYRASGVVDQGDPDRLADAALGATYVGADRITAQKVTATSLLRNFRRSLANRNAAGVDILAIGDSLTEGQAATALGSRWVDRFRDNLRTRYQPAGVAGGVGYLPAYYNNATVTDPFTLSGSAVVQGSQGLGRRSVRMGTTAGSMTSISVQATRIEIFYTKASGNGVFSVSIDGGAATNIDCNSASFVRGNKVAFNVAAGAHTVVLTWVSGGQTYVEGMMVYNGDEAAGIRMWEGAKAGVTAAEYTSSTDWTGAVKTINPALVLLCLGTNDYSQDVPLATYKANVQSIISSVRSQNPSTPPSIAIVVPHQRADVSDAARANPWSAFVDTMYAIAREDGDIAVIDLYARLGLAESTSGVWNADLVHMTNMGHALWADHITRVIESHYA